MIYPSREQPRWEKISIMDYPLIDDFSLGNGTMFKLITFKIHRRFFVGLQRIGCFLFGIENYKSIKYVSEKLNTCEADSACIADWINVQIGVKAQEFGHYFLWDD